MNSFVRPVFQPELSEVFLELLEAQFEINNITNDRQKYLVAITCLPPETLTCIPPEVRQEKKFEALKDAIKNLYTKSLTENFDQLLNQAHGHDIPSQYLRKIRHLAEKCGATEELVRYKFLQSLPPEIRAPLTLAKTMSLEEVGKLADELMPIISAKQILNTVATTRQSNRQTSLTSQSATYNMADQAIPISIRAYKPNQRTKVCRAHLYYGNEARQCKRWCILNRQGLSIMPDSRPGTPTTNQQEN